MWRCRTTGSGTGAIGLWGHGIMGLWGLGAMGVLGDGAMARRGYPITGL
jgi:hypothetical protein